MSDIIAMHRADLVDAVTEAVKPLKATIATLEGRCRDNQDALNIVMLIDERMGNGWTRDLAHALFPSHPCFAKETP